VGPRLLCYRLFKRRQLWQGVNSIDVSRQSILICFRERVLNSLLKGWRFWTSDFGFKASLWPPEKTGDYPLCFAKIIGAEFSADVSILVSRAAKLITADLKCG